MGEKIWHAALYLRLSREDGDKEESDSVLSQKALLERYLSEHPELKPAGVFTDDGYTGTDFDRPGFQKMLSAIYEGKINCVVVKDLSRFGRNYVQSGKYLEEVFPLYGVRFIALGDNIDSFADPSSLDSILVPFKNILNDEYSRDISRKVRSTLDIKRKNGEFIGSFAPYGYQKSKKNKNKLEIDPIAAETVREIFALFLSGKSIDAIVRQLNAGGVPNPSAYKKRQGLAVRRQGESPFWQHSTVRRILQNRVYLGDMVQGRRRVTSYKLHRLRPVPEEGWMVVEGTHPAIIGEEQFEAAGRLLRQNARTSGGELTLFAGFLRCGDCGRAMNRKSVKSGGKVYHYYICGSYKQDRTLCSKHAIREDRLIFAVLETIRAQISLAESFEVIKEKLKERKGEGDRKKELQRKSAQLLSEIEKYRRLSESLYPDWKAGDLTREEYHSLKERYLKRQEALQKELSSLQPQEEPKNEFLEEFLAQKNFPALTREVLNALVEQIDIYEENRIRVRFRFSAGFETLRQDLSR